MIDFAITHQKALDLLSGQRQRSEGVRAECERLEARRTIARRFEGDTVPWLTV